VKRSSDHVRVLELSGWRVVAAENGVAVGFHYDMSGRKHGGAAVDAELADREERTGGEIGLDGGCVRKSALSVVGVRRRSNSAAQNWDTVLSASSFAHQLRKTSATTIASCNLCRPFRWGAS
jgi:hypothetical protein